MDNQTPTTLPPARKGRPPIHDKTMGTVCIKLEVDAIAEFKRVSAGREISMGALVRERLTGKCHGCQGYHRHGCPESD